MTGRKRLGLSTKEIGIFASFLVFLLLIVMFAALYLAIYHHEPKSFIFSADILSSQIASLLQSTRLQVESDAAAVEALSDIARRRAQESEDVVSADLPSGKRYQVTRRPVFHGGVAGVEEEVKVWGKDGNQLAEVHIFGDFQEKKSQYETSLDNRYSCCELLSGIARQVYGRFGIFSTLAQLRKLRWVTGICCQTALSFAW